MLVLKCFLKPAWRHTRTNRGARIHGVASCVTLSPDVAHKFAGAHTNSSNVNSLIPALSPYANREISVSMVE